MKIVILADIHANLSALQAVLQSITSKQVDAYALLGDVIDYGMRPNETIGMLESLDKEVICNIWGNHEKAIIEKDFKNFSSERGKVCSDYTSRILNKSAFRYIKDDMNASGNKQITIEGKKILFIHGSLPDPFWKSITVETDLKEYEQYDYVFSAHSHRPHMFEQYYAVNNQRMRGKKKTTFINVGSVGQPRNHNPHAQYGIFDTKTGAIQLQCIPYDVKMEQALYQGQVDTFYQERLAFGI